MTKGQSLFIAVITLIGLIVYQYQDVIRSKFAENFSTVDGKFLIKALLTILLFAVLQYVLKKLRRREEARRLGTGKSESESDDRQ